MPDVCICENLRVNMLSEKVTHLASELLMTTTALDSGVHFLLVGAAQQPITTISS